MPSKSWWPYFAQWRWGTLCDTCVAIESVLGTLRMWFPRFEFVRIVKSDEAKVIGNVRHALGCSQWAYQLRFVGWLCRWLTGLQRWGQTCPCHEKGSAGAAECMRKGRLLQWAHKRVMDTFAEGLLEAEAWCAKDLGCSESQLIELQGCVRLVVAFGGAQGGFPRRHTIPVSSAWRIRRVGSGARPVLARAA